MKVIIVYELRNREYDNALLLKSELEKRNYKVEILYKSEMFKLFYQNAVVLVPNCYNTTNFEYYYYTLNCNKNALIDMQYEQILSKKIEEVGFHNPKGKAQKVLHLCWGNDAYNRLLNNGVKSDYLRITGAIHLDFLRKEFSEYWYSREELAEKYNLPMDKKWLFYISSFSFVDNDYIISQTLEAFDENYLEDFSVLSKRSQIYTLDWFDRILSTNNDCIIIYRCHPVEKESEMLKKLINKHNGKFFSIAELSVKQWIICSDVMMTWFSTSIIEVYMAKKQCLILRPLPIPSYYDAAVYIGCNYISTYEEFSNTINKFINENSINDFPIDSKLINHYYEIYDVPTYIRIADIVDEVAEVIRKSKRNSELRKRCIYLVKNHIVLKYVIKKFYKFLYRNFGLSVNVKKIRDKYALFDWENRAIKEKDYAIDEKNKETRLNKIIRRTYCE